MYVVVLDFYHGKKIQYRNIKWRGEREEGYTDIFPVIKKITLML